MSQLPILPRRRGRRRWVILIGVLLMLALAAGIYAVTLGRPSGAATAATVPVTRGTLLSTVTASGTLVAEKTVSLAFQTAGLIQSLDARPGDSVTPGQVVARLDDRKLQIQLANAQAGLGGAQARLAQARQGSVRPEEIAAAQAALTTYLRERHRLKPDGSADDFQVQSMAAQLEQANTILNVLTLFLGSVAGISLLVGGIGIMNIMLVSVTERTREIGLRKAVGARGWDLLWQFLVEALVLSVTGGIVGLGLAAGLALIVTATGLLMVSVTPQSVALALGFSLAVGLFFGLYPAQRAARLNPIDALRFE